MAPRRSKLDRFCDMLEHPVTLLVLLAALVGWLVGFGPHSH
ncbi:MAG: hypothetical protein V1797_07120 [Pseudomonadota bacterium]